MPECPMPLLHGDLLSKLQALTTFPENSVQLRLPQENAWKAQIYLLQLKQQSEQEISNEILDVIFPLV